MHETHYGSAGWFAEVCVVKEGAHLRGREGSLHISLGLQPSYIAHSQQNRQACANEIPFWLAVMPLSAGLAYASY